MATDSESVDVSNNYTDNHPSVPVAAKLISGRRYQYVIQTDSAGVPINAGSVSSVTTEAVIAVAVTSTAVLAANANRNPKSWVKNISDTDIYVSLSGTATTAKPTRLAPGDVYIFGFYTGAVSAIHAGSGTKSLEVVEL